MEKGAGTRRGPYHPGELDVQRRAGVRESAERTGRGVSPTLTMVAARQMADMRLAVAASLDGRSRVWASILTGPPGFLRPVDAQLMLVERHPRESDPLAHNLGVRRELGLLAIDLVTRKRLRFNGNAVHDPARGIFLAVEQVYGNCPKYIQARCVEAVGARAGDPPPVASAAPTARQRALIAAADTFFIASFHPDRGADASHRGGAPGFVRILDDRTLAFGEYRGNDMFNTLGNLAVQPRAGLLFLDFATGATLQLTGTARLDWNPAVVASFRGARNVVVIFEVEECLEIPGAGVCGRLLEPSPVNP